MFNLLEMGFSEFEIFLFGLIRYFGALGFDDFAGFEKMVILRFLIFGFASLLLCSLFVGSESKVKIFLRCVFLG